MSEPVQCSIGVMAYNEDKNIGNLLHRLTNLFDGTRFRFDLLYYRFSGAGISVDPIDGTEDLFPEVEAVLSPHGWKPENRLALQGSPQGLVRRIQDYSLIVTCLPQRMGPDSSLVQLLGDTFSPILLFRQ